MDTLLNAYQIIIAWLRGLVGNDSLWVVEVFLIILVTLFTAFLFNRFLRKLEEKAKNTTSFWDDSLLRAVRRPAQWVIWIVGLSAALQVVASKTDSLIFSYLATLRYLAVIFVIAWFLVRFIKQTENQVVARSFSSESSVDATTAMAVGKLLRISVIITTVLVILQTLGFSISGVLAFGGIGGIAVGFAAKDLLSNFFGGLMIFWDRPFAVGDWIRSPDQEIEGTVEDIGWRLTRIRTFDKRPLYVPNSTFTHISVENPSRMSNRRIYETIGLRYDDSSKIETIINDVKIMLEQHDAIDTNNTLMVNFNTFASSSLDFFIYCFTKTTNWVEFHSIKQDVLLKILTIVETHDAECAFPTSTIHIPEGITKIND